MEIVANLSIGPWSSLHVTQFVYLSACVIYVAVMLFHMFWLHAHASEYMGVLESRHPFVFFFTQFADSGTIALAVWVVLTELSSLWLPWYDPTLAELSDTVAWAIPPIIVWWPVRTIMHAMVFPSQLAGLMGDDHE